MNYPELEISFHHRDESYYGVELRFEDPQDSQAGNFFGPFPVKFDWDMLRELVLTPSEYGKALSTMFFRDEGIGKAFAFAAGYAADREGLRLRLCLSPSTPRLHDVLWETLQEPTTHSPFSTNERFLTSRFMSSWDFRPVHLRRKDAQRALVVIANPKGLGSQRVGDRAFAPINVGAEWERAQSNLGSIATQKLAENGEASLDRLSNKLREGFDILYLVCHGALVRGEPLLWLEDDDGSIARIKGIDLVLRLKDMLRPPRLVVLCSCQSAGVGEQARSDDKGALVSLGPRLAEGGIPSVIAMQDNIRMSTAATFFSIFFRELMMDGQIDRAMAVARSAIRACDDWWVPVLITRLKRGRIWYEHDGSAAAQFQKWQGLVHDTGAAGCTPILGPDLVATLLGSPTEVARRWAERYDFPMAPHERDSLPQVAQYLAYHQQSTSFPRNELREHIREFLLRTYPDKLPEGGTESARRMRLDALITHIGNKLRADNNRDLHRMLAQLPFPIFVTTNRDNLLFDALKEAGKDPRMDICRWAVFEEDQDSWPQSVFVAESGYKPDVQHPLVFHMFGNMRYPDTLVLAEDDYFDYLIGVNKHERHTFVSGERETGTEPFPPVIARAFAKRGLLFLGFRISDWEFRTLFRGILARESKRGMRKHTNVSVQLQPGEGEFLEPQGARSFIEDYFRPYQVDVYWGSAEEFIERLVERWKQAGAPEPSEDDLAR